MDVKIIAGVDSIVGEITGMVGASVSDPVTGAAGVTVFWLTVAAVSDG